MNIQRTTGLFLLVSLFLVLLCGCMPKSESNPRIEPSTTVLPESSQPPTDLRELYPQSELTKPSRMLLIVGENEHTFEPEDKTFEALFSAIEKTWWIKDGSKSNFQLMAAAMVLNLDLKADYKAILYFIYDQPVLWELNATTQHYGTYVFYPFDGNYFAVAENEKERNLTGAVFWMKYSDRFSSIIEDL